MVVSCWVGNCWCLDTQFCGFDLSSLFQWTAITHIWCEFDVYNALHLPERLGEVHKKVVTVETTLDMTKDTTWTQPLPAAQAGAESLQPCNNIIKTSSRSSLHASQVESSGGQAVFDINPLNCHKIPCHLRCTIALHGVTTGPSFHGSRRTSLENLCPFLVARGRRFNGSRQLGESHTSYAGEFDTEYRCREVIKCGLIACSLIPLPVTPISCTLSLCNRQSRHPGWRCLYIPSKDWSRDASHCPQLGFVFCRTLPLWISEQSLSAPSAWGWSSICGYWKSGSKPKSIGCLGYLGLLFLDFFHCMIYCFVYSP